MKFFFLLFVSFLVVIVTSFTYGQTLTWQQLSKKSAPNRAANGLLGTSVDIDTDGSTMIIGAPGAASNTGAAYISERGSDANSNIWPTLQPLTTTQTNTGDEFGKSVAIGSNYAVVGAPFTNVNNGTTLSDAGAIYIFEKNGSTWTEVQRIVADSPIANSQFGSTVAINDDVILVGAPASGNGRVYVLQRSESNVWAEQQVLTASTAASGDEFGFSVALSGDFAIIGAPSEDEDASETNTVNNAGAAYIFEQDASNNWSEIHKIVAPNRNMNDHFGHAVAMNGLLAIVGAPQEDEDADEANTLSNAGAAYILERNTGPSNNDWTIQQKIVAYDREADDQFGTSVALSVTRALVGAPFEDEDENEMNTLSNAGAAYPFRRDTGGDWRPFTKIVATDRVSGAQFGHSVGYSSINEYTCLGAFEEDRDEAGENALNNAGAAYVFQLARSQTITFDLGDNATSVFGDGLNRAFTLNGTASSGLTVRYTSSDEAVASINGNRVTITGAGTTTLTASQEGSIVYHPAPSVEQVLTVERSTITSLEDIFNTLQLYPNPTVQWLTIKNVPTQRFTFHLSDSQGQKIHSGEGKEDLVLDLSLLPAGFYTITLQTSKGTVTKKLIKQ
ncbi:MAG: T9SS type A sorting domain-containing protein [Thermonemataceae bacterium]